MKNYVKNTGVAKPVKFNGISDKSCEVHQNYNKSNFIHFP